MFLFDAHSDISHGMTSHMENSYHAPFNRIRAALSGRPLPFLPKGEVWLGSSFLAEAGLEDTFDNHFRMAGLLGQDMVCLSVTDGLGPLPADPGYRYFEVSHLKKAENKEGLFISIVVDGPFQSLVNQKGLMAVIKTWMKHRDDLLKACDSESLRLLTLISRCLDLGVHGVVIAEDLAAERGPLISPGDIDRFCTPFFKKAADMIHQARAAVLMHSCGDLTRLLPVFKTWGLDGLAAVQHHGNDFSMIRQFMGQDFVILGGIDAGLLEPGQAEETLSGFSRIVTRFSKSGGMILGSSCGLYHGRFFPRIKEIYSLADEFYKRF